MLVGGRGDRPTKTDGLNLNSEMSCLSCRVRCRLDRRQYRHRFLNDTGPRGKGPGGKEQGTLLAQYLVGTGKTVEDYADRRTSLVQSTTMEYECL